MTPLEDGVTTLEPDENVKNYSNDPLGSPDGDLSMIKAMKERGRPKKGDTSIKPIHIIYNTRNRIFVSKVVSSAASI